MSLMTFVNVGIRSTQIVRPCQCGSAAWLRSISKEFSGPIVWIIEKQRPIKPLSLAWLVLARLLLWPLRVAAALRLHVYVEVEMFRQGLDDRVVAETFS